MDQVVGEFGHVTYKSFFLVYDEVVCIMIAAAMDLFSLLVFCIFHCG